MPTRRSRRRGRTGDSNAGDGASAAANAANAEAAEDAGADAADAAAEDADGAPEDVAALLPSPCQEPDPSDELVQDVPVRIGDRIIFSYRLCGSATRRLIVHFQKATQPANKVLDQEIRTSDPIPVELRPVEPGRHTLTWTFVPEAEAWQHKAEVEVNGAVRFRRYKSTTANITAPPFGFVIMEVAS